MYKKGYFLFHIEGDLHKNKYQFLNITALNEDEHNI